MRCVARGLLAGFITVLLTLYIALTSSNVSTQLEYSVEEEGGGDYEETLRLLEGSDQPATTNRPQASLSAIVVVISCLILISLLIAGIIVVAMTMDPSHDDDSPTDDEEAQRSYTPNAEPTVPQTSLFGRYSEYDSLFDDEESLPMPVREL